MTGFSALPLAEAGDDDRLVGVARILGPRWAQLPAITIGLLGVQVFWSVEMSYGTPYLLSLGLSKAAVAVVFLAGPISGLVVQPLIGVLADNSKSRFGRRRPYMIVGSFVCVAAMLLLGFTRPFASLFLPPSHANDILTTCLAILALFTIDFSINAVQAVDRALIVDTLPSREQADANAWAARMLGFGSVAGYFIGNIDMTAVLPFLGKTQLEVLAVVGSFLLLSTHALTAFCTKEKVVLRTKAIRKSLARELLELWQNIFTLPPLIRQICIIQFFSWVGWFPVLFYTSAFIGDLYKRSFPLAPSDPNLDAEATRLGTRALFYSSLLSVVGNIILPFFVAESARSRRSLERRLVQAHKNAWVLRIYEHVKINLATLWAFSHLVFALCMFATFFYSTVAGATFFTTLTGFSWSITQWAPFSLLAEAILSEQAPGEDGDTIALHDTRTHRSLVPGEDDNERQFLVGAEEEEEEEETDTFPRSTHEDDERTLAFEEDVQSFSSSASMDSDKSHTTSLNDARPKPHRRSPSSENGPDNDAERGNIHSLLSNTAARASHVDMHSLVMSGSDTLHDDDGEEDEPRQAGNGLAAKAGIIIGIHNIFIVIPQFIMTGLASIVFTMFEPPKAAEAELPLSTDGGEALTARAEAVVGGGGPNSYVIIYRLGGLSAAVAFVLTLRLARELRHH